jgi:hypothetical protein
VEEARQLNLPREWLRELNKYKRVSRYTNMSEAQKDEWYAQIDRIRHGHPRLAVKKHKPLEELAVFCIKKSFPTFTKVSESYDPEANYSQAVL